MKKITDKRQTTLNLITSILAFAINVGINFKLTPYIIERLGNEAYGFIGLAFDFVNYATILTMAVNGMSSRFISIEYHKGNKEKAEKYFNSVLVANLIIAAFVAFASIFIVWKLEYIINIPPYLKSDVKLTFSILFINYMVSICSSSFNCGAFVKNRLDKVYFRNMFSYVLKLIVTVLLISLFDIKIYFISLTTLICSIYLAVANFIIMRQLIPEIKLSVKEFDKNSLKEIMSSGIWMSLQSLSTLLLTGLNSILTNKFIGTMANGYLSVAKSIPSYISQLGQQLAQVFTPKFTIIYAKGNVTELIKEAKRSMRTVSFIMSVPIAGFIAFGFEFYSLWVKNYTSAQIHEIQLLSVIVTIPYIFSTIAYPLVQINAACNKIRTPVIFTFIVGVLNVLIVFPLGHFNVLTLELLTASTSVMLSIRYALFQPYYASHVLNAKKSEFYLPLIKNSLIVGVFALIFYQTKKIIPINNWMSFFVSAGLNGIVGYIISFFLVFKKSEYKEIIGTIKDKVLKK